MKELSSLFIHEFPIPATQLEREYLLVELGFVYIDTKIVRMGTTHPLRSKLEGRRLNETPARLVEIKPFWISCAKVTNKIFEMLNPNHIRPPQSLHDDSPVVEITYSEVIEFCEKANELTEMKFRLPTEPEWVCAASPYGWEFTYQSTPYNPKKDNVHVFGDGYEMAVAVSERISK